MKSVRVKSRRNSSVIALVTAAVAGFGAMNAAKAVPTTYTYTPTNATSDVWSAGTNWSATPVSATDTTLTFNATGLTGGFANINTDDIGGQFLLTVLNLNGTGPASGGAASITIAKGGTATGLTLGATVNLAANAGTSGLTYNVSAPVTLGATATFTGTGTATFNFSGGLSGSASATNLTKSGSSALTLGGTTTLGQMSVGLNGVSGTVTVASGASLSVGTTGINQSLNVGATSNAGTTFNGTLDVSQASSFTTNVSTLQVGYNAGNSTSGNGALSGGTLSLGLNNNITATTAVRIGEASNVSNQVVAGGTFATTAAGGTTTITTPILRIGYGKAIASFILGSGSTVTVAGTSGGRTALDVGTTTFNTGGVLNATLDASLGIFNGTLNSLVVGSSSSNNAAGSTTATATLSANALNHLDVSGASTATQGVVTVGRNLSTNATVNGTLTIGNLDATSSITSTNDGIGILVGYGAAAGSTANGTVNLNGGTLTITTAGRAISGSPTASVGGSTVNFRGITLEAGKASTDWIGDLDTANLGTGGLKVDTNSFNLATAQVFSGTGNLTKQGAGTLTLTGNNTFTGGVSVQAGTLVAGTASALGNGAALSTVSVTGGTLDLNGASVLALNIGASDFSLNGGTLSLTLGGTFDTINSTGTFTLTSGTIALGGTVADGTYQILNFTSGTVGSVAFTGVADGHAAYLSSTGLLTVVPEPATTSVAIALGLAVLVVTKRMRARRNA